MNLEEHIKAGGTHDLETDDRGRVRCGCGTWGQASRFMPDPWRCPNCWGREARAVAAFARALKGAAPGAWRTARRREYARMDAALLEALAEEREGRPEKMQAYLARRAAIRDAHPKDDQ